MTNLNQPVRKVEVNPSEKWNSKERENKEEEVPRVRGHLKKKQRRKRSNPKVGHGHHLLVGQVGKTTSGVTMEDNPFPDCVLHNSKEGIEHVVEHLLSKHLIKKSFHLFVRPNLCTSNVTLRVKRTTCPAKDIKGGVPESIVAKGDAKVDTKSRNQKKLRLEFV